jgi:tetratricopeptide (TPR) repeat protein
MVEPLVYCRPFAPRALLAYIQQGLAGCKGPIAPLNAEASASPVVLSAEKWVNLTILRAADGDVAGAERAARAALARVPAHPEALKQLGLLLANQKGDLEGAIRIFQRLLSALRNAGDPAADVAEIQTVIRSLQELAGAVPRGV